MPTPRAKTHTDRDQRGYQARVEDHDQHRSNEKCPSQDRHPHFLDIPGKEPLTGPLGPIYLTSMCRYSWVTPRVGDSWAYLGLGEDEELTLMTSGTACPSLKSIINDTS